MTIGAAWRFIDTEAGNLTGDNLNGLDPGGNVYRVGAGSLLVNVSPCRYVTTGGTLDFGGSAGVALPPSTIGSQVYLTVPGNVLTVGTFPGGEHLPLAEVDTNGTEVTAIRDKRHAMASAVSGTPPGDVTGPVSNTAGALALFSGTSGKVLADGPVPAAASGLATLDGSSKVVQNPASAQTAAAAAKIPLADGGGKLADGWLNHVPAAGADPQYQASAARQTNSTTTPLAHTTLVIPALTGTYEIHWKGELDNATLAGRADLYNLTDAAVLDGPQQKTNAQASDLEPVGGFAQLVMAGAGKSVAVRFWDVGGGNTQGLQGVKLSLRRVQ